jgi:serpin B
MTAPPVPTAPATDADRAAVTRGDRAFASRLYAKLRTREGNLFFSPTSIRLALAMAYAGARGDTAAEMKEVLALDGEERSIHAGFAALLRDFEGEKNPELTADADAWQRAEAERKKQLIRMVNRLWGQEGRPFEPEFLALLETHYAAPLERLDFLHASENARIAINALVAEQTDQRITELVPESMLTPDTKLVLTNAVYFKAKWEDSFNERLTTEGPFHVSPAATVTTKLMTQTAYFKYAKVDDVQLLELPYASGRMAMVVALPDGVTGLAKLEPSMGFARKVEVAR